MTQARQKILYQIHGWDHYHVVGKSLFIVTSLHGVGWLSVTERNESLPCLLFVEIFDSNNLRLRLLPKGSCLIVFSIKLSLALKPPVTFGHNMKENVTLLCFLTPYVIMMPYGVTDFLPS